MTFAQDQHSLVQELVTKGSQKEIWKKGFGSRGGFQHAQGRVKLIATYQAAASL